MDPLSAVLPRTPVIKGVNDDQWQAMIDFVTANLEPLLAKAFVQAMNDLRDDISLAQLERLMSSPDAVAQAVLGIFDHGKVFDDLRDGVQKSFMAGAKYWKDAARIDISFDLFHPQTVRTIQQQTFGLIQQVSEATRQGVKEYVSASVENGVNPRETARQVKRIIGLTARQTRAVANYRKYLTQGKPAALQRELRDRRHDKTVARAIEQGVKLSQEQIDTMVGKYEQRYLAYRAEVVSRTEALTALHNSQQEVWRQAVENGDVEYSGMYRRWFVAHGERTCPTCKEVPGMNEDGVALDQPFQTPLGPVMGPPLHPQCRCTVFTRPRVRRE